MRKVRFLERATSRLVVRPLRAADYAAWRDAHANRPPAANLWDGSPRLAGELTRAKYRALLRQHATARRADTFYYFGVFEKNRDGDGGRALVGMVSIMEVARRLTQTAYLGYGIFNPYWGRGYGPEAARAVIDIAFRDLKLHRLEAGIEPNNRRSLRLAKSMGLRREGVKKRCLFIRDGWRDLVMYSVTCEDVGIPFLGEARVE